MCNRKLVNTSATVQGRLYFIEALVHMGTTSARGDDPMDVVEMTVREPHGAEIYVPKYVEQALEEEAMILARTIV